MATTAPTTGWSNAISLAPGALYSFVVAPASGGTIYLQWSADNVSWTSFSNNGFSSNAAGAIPASAAFLRGMSIGAAGTFDFSVAGDHGLPVTQVTVTAGSQSAASANVAAIQLGLNAGGLVQVLAAGIVYINATLVIYGNTRLILGPLTTLKLVAGTGLGVNLINNYALTQSGSPTTITWTWSSGLTATITWNNHGRSVNDYVWTQGNTVPMFNGCFRISSLTDANNFVVDLWRLPSGSPSGTSTALLMDQNIWIEGGVWDYDYSNNTTATNVNGQAVRLGMVRKLTLRELTFGVSQSYNLFLGAVVDFLVDGTVHRNNNSDAIKVIGPAKNGLVRNASGRVNDDGVSAQPKIRAGYIGYRFSYGDMIGIAFEDIDIEINRSGPSVALLYPSVSEWSDIAFRRIKGKTLGSGSGVSVYGDDASANVAGNVDIDGVDVCATYSVRLQGTGTICRKFSAKNVVFNPIANTGASVFTQDAGTTLGAGYFHLQGDVSAWGASDYAINLFGTYSYVEIAGFLTPSSTGRLCQLGTGSAGGLVRVVGVRQTAGDGCVNIPANVTGKVVFDGCELSSTAILTSTGSGTNEVEFNNSRFLSASNGVVRTTGTPTLTIKGLGSTLVSGSWVVAVSGTPVFNIYSWDIPVDVGATGFNKTTSGQFCFNNGSGRGTLTQNRLVTCNGTNWVQVDTPANVF